MFVNLKLVSSPKPTPSSLSLVSVDRITNHIVAQARNLEGSPDHTLSYLPRPTSHSNKQVLAILLSSSSPYHYVSNPAATPCLPTSGLSPAPGTICPPSSWVNHKRSLGFAVSAQDLPWSFLTYSPNLASFQLPTLGPGLQPKSHLWTFGFQGLTQFPLLGCDSSALCASKTVFILVLPLNPTPNLSHLASRRWPVLVPTRREGSTAQGPPPAQAFEDVSLLVL